VHRLRPGDIDIIGAMGDSLTAGTGSAAANLFELTIDNRGMSWSAGEFTSSLNQMNLAAGGASGRRMHILYLGKDNPGPKERDYGIHLSVFKLVKTFQTNQKRPSTL
jgi:hypothetical protein